MKLLALSLILILSSCGIFKKKSNNTENNEVVQKIDLKASFGDLSHQSDLITIKSAKMEGHLLTLDISYSGGCKDHSFEMLASKMIMKSLPPKRAIKLIHHANGDHCRQLINKTLVIDMSDVAHSKNKGDVLMLLLDGYREPIKYIYP